MKSELCFGVLNRALEEELGLAIESNNPKQLSFYLHECVKGLDKYADLMICIPSLPDHIFITKRSVELNEVQL